MDPSQMTLAAVSRELKAGDLQATEVVESIAQAARNRDKDVGGYLSMDVEAALTLAKKADPSLPLGGIPIAIMDVISVAGQPCSCASKMLEGYIAPYDAAVIERLKAAGGIPLGRTNMDEFAMGSSTENSGLQKTVNPWDHSLKDTAISGLFLGAGC
ncbi:MAG: amidase [Verrucomicrobiota bacterium]